MPPSPGPAEEPLREELLQGERIACLFRWFFLGLLHLLAWVVWLVQGRTVGLWGVVLSAVCLAFNLVVGWSVRRGRTDPWIRWSAMFLDLAFLTAYNALDAAWSSPFAPVTSATLLVYPIVLFVGALRLDRLLILASTLFAAFGLNLLYFLQRPRMDPRVVDQLVSADLLGQGYRTAYLLLFGLLLLILPGTVRRLVASRAEAWAKALRAERLALQDPVTGLANHRALEAWVDQIHATGEGLSLVALRLPDLPALNALLGRASADFAVVEIARRLERLPGPDGLAARLPDGRFVVAAPLSTDANDAPLLDAVRSALAVPLPLSGWKSPLEVRSSLAASPADGSDLDTLLRATEDRLAISPSPT